MNSIKVDRNFLCNLKFLIFQKKSLFCLKLKNLSYKIIKIFRILKEKKNILASNLISEKIIKRKAILIITFRKKIF
jgi:hypothetical protein